MQGNLYTFVNFWRSRGMNIRSGFRLWQYAQEQIRSKGFVRFTDSTLRWAKAQGEGNEITVKMRRSFAPRAYGGVSGHGGV